MDLPKQLASVMVCLSRQIADIGSSKLNSNPVLHRRSIHDRCVHSRWMSVQRCLHADKQ